MLSKFRDTSRQKFGVTHGVQSACLAFILCCWHCQGQKRGDRSAKLLLNRTYLGVSMVSETMGSYSLHST